MDYNSYKYTPATLGGAAEGPKNLLGQSNTFHSTSSSLPPVVHNAFSSNRRSLQVMPRGGSPNLLTRAGNHSMDLRTQPSLQVTQLASKQIGREQFSISVADMARTRRPAVPFTSVIENYHMVDTNLKIPRKGGYFAGMAARKPNKTMFDDIIKKNEKPETCSPNPQKYAHNTSLLSKQSLPQSKSKKISLFQEVAEKSKGAVGPAQYDPKPVRAKIRGSYLEQKDTTSSFDQAIFDGDTKPSPQKYDGSIEKTTKYSRTVNMMFISKEVRSKDMPKEDLSPHSHQTGNFAHMLRDRSPNWSYGKGKETMWTRNIKDKQWVPGVGTHKFDLKNSLDKLSPGPQPRYKQGR